MGETVTEWKRGLKKFETSGYGIISGTNVVFSANIHTLQNLAGI